MSEQTLDSIMESASVALTTTHYLRCEALCLKALAMARRGGNWPNYARVLMPLQEARRQRRMIAAEGVIRLGSASLQGEPSSWLEHMESGCIVLTPPFRVDHARELWQLSRKQQRYVEVLFAESQVSDERWKLRSFAGPPVDCTVPAPPVDCLDRWLQIGTTTSCNGTRVETRQADQISDGTCDFDLAVSASDWFLDACETLGDAALARVVAALGSVERIIQLERCLDVVTDHEITHQRLGDAARAVRCDTTADS